jgi:hypothetical protein
MVISTGDVDLRWRTVIVTVVEGHRGGVDAVDSHDHVARLDAGLLGWRAWDYSIDREGAVVVGHHHADAGDVGTQ